MIRSRVLFPEPLPPITPNASLRGRTKARRFQNFFFLGIDFRQIFDAEDVLWRHKLKLS